MSNKDELISIGIDEETIDCLFKSYSQERQGIFTKDCKRLYDAGYKGYIWVIASWGSHSVDLELDMMRYESGK